MRTSSSRLRRGIAVDVGVGRKNIGQRAECARHSRTAETCGETGWLQFACGRERRSGAEPRLRAEESRTDARCWLCVAREQFVVNPYTFPTMESVLAVTSGKYDTRKVEKEEKVAWVTLSAGNTSVTFNHWNGWIDYLDVDGKPMLEEGYAITPDFWRARPTTTTGQAHNASCMLGRILR